MGVIRSRELSTFSLGHDSACSLSAQLHRMKRWPMSLVGNSPLPFLTFQLFPCRCRQRKVHARPTRYRRLCHNSIYHTCSCTCPRLPPVRYRNWIQRHRSTPHQEDFWCMNWTRWAWDTYRLTASWTMTLKGRCCYYVLPPFWHREPWCSRALCCGGLYCFDEGNWPQS